MTDDKTVLAVRQYIDRFDRDASRQAVLRAAELSAEGDEEGAAIWLHIGKTVDALVLKGLPPAAPPH